MTVQVQPLYKYIEMYYRHKILLSLIKTFGGTLSNTDCQKLMFLFGKRSNTDYYDFFPYHFGSFSYVLYNDKRLLIYKSFLLDEDKFTIAQKRDTLSITRPDQIAINNLKGEIGNTRGKKLIGEIYKEFPYYASKSKIAPEIFTTKDLDQFRSQPENTSICLFTIGYEGKSIDAYINKLIESNIKLLIDVRKNPISRKFGFSKSKLESYLANSGIGYLHLPELGIPSSLRKNLNNKDDYIKLFNTYTSTILSSQHIAIDKIIENLDLHKRIALTCFEADQNYCHRGKITDRFERDPKFTIPIIHLN